MKRMKITFVLAVVIIIQFVCYLAGCAADYREGVRLVAAGEYEKAGEIFAELDGYQDSEVLVEYCAVMAEYNAFDYTSVFRTYHDLKEIEIDNEYLEVEIACNRAEVSALYMHCGEVFNVG